MSAEPQVYDIAPDEMPADDRSADKARREGLFILLGSLAVGLIVAFVRQDPAGTPQGATTAAAATAPVLGAEMARALDVVRGNVGAWRLISLVLIGSVAGMVVNRLIPGNRAGTFAAAFIGILGAALAGLVSQHLGYVVPGCISVASIVAAFVGATVTLFAAKLLAMV